METRAERRNRRARVVEKRAEKMNKEATAVETRASRRNKEAALAIAGTGSRQSPLDMDIDAKGWSRKRRQEEEEEVVVVVEDEESEDEEAANMVKFRDWWNFICSKRANFEDNTDIPSMLYTDERERRVIYREALQVFTIEVKEIKRGLQWPIEVFGHVALRDAIDRKRNLIFKRDRENCQTLTKEDSFLVLTGPSRAALAFEAIDFEVDLKVKGYTKSEDKVLSSLAFPYVCLFSDGRVERDVRSNKHSTLATTFARLKRTVEATVHVEFAGGLWGHFLPHFFASTHHLPKMKFVLLDPREGPIVVGEDGAVKLTRSVVAVEVHGGLKLTMEALEADGKTISAVGRATFEPQDFGRANQVVDLGFCKIRVTVAWSQLSLWGY